MAFKSFSFHRPDTAEMFETWCLTLFRVVLQTPELQKYGRRGQRQYGVDLFGQDIEGRPHGVQCKLRNTDLGLTPALIDTEVENAKQFRPPLKTYTIATTADRDAILQSHVAELNKKHRHQDLFSIKLYCWHDIEDFLNQHHEVRALIYGPDAPQLPDRAPGKSLRAPATVEGSHVEITEASRYVDDGRPDVALAMLEQIRNRSWDLLDDRGKYRVLANEGTALVSLGRLREGGNKYLEAAAYSRHDEKAQAFAATGHFLVGEPNTAYELAARLCEEHPQLARAHTIRIHTSPQGLSFDELLSSTPTNLRKNQEVALALSRRAATSGLLEVAEQYARDAYTADQSWTETAFNLSAVLIERTRAHGNLDTNALNEAVRLLSDLIDKLNERADTTTLPYALVNRATARRLLGDLALANDDLRDALRRAPHDADVLLANAVALAPTDLDKAIETLLAVSENTRPVHIRFFLAQLLNARGRTEDLARAAAELRLLLANLPSHLPEQQNDITCLYADTLAASRATDELRSITDAYDTVLTPLMQHVLKGRIHAHLGEASEAATAADHALEQLCETTSIDEQRRLAILLERLRRPYDALTVWKRFVPTDVFDPDVQMALRCAQHCRDYTFITDHCASLRQAGVYDPDVAGLEFNTLLEVGEFSCAAKLLQDYLTKKPGDPWALVNLSLLGIQMHKPELLQTDAKRFPPPSDVDPELGQGIVRVLCHNPDRNLAVRYAYTLLRRFPQNPDARKAVIASFFLPSKYKVTIQNPASAQPGAAVCIRYDDEPENRWIIIEDESTPSPDLSRQEYAPTHALSKALAGKKANDTFSARAPFEDKKGQVVQLLDKAVRRFHECCEQWEHQFPDDPFIQRFSVPRAPGSKDDPKAVLGRVFDVIKRRHDRLDELQQIYVRERVPISMFAKATAHSLFETTGYLATTPGLPLRCAYGTVNEFIAATSALATSTSVMLDTSTIAILHLLSEIDLLATLPFRCVVSERSLTTIQDLIDPQGDSSEPRYRLDMQDGQVVRIEISAEQQTMNDATLRKLTDCLKDSCEVVGGGATARLDRSTRDKLLESLCPETVEAIAIAKERGIPLWSDDLVASTLAQNLYGVGRTWTQGTLIYLHRIGQFDKAALDRATVALTGFGCSFTGLSDSAFAFAAEKADWDPNAQPLQSVLPHFSLTTLDPVGLLRLLACSLRRVWREAPEQEAAARVTDAILDEIGRREDGLDLVAVVHRNIGVLFGTDVMTLYRAQRTIDLWLLRQPPRRFLVIGSDSGA